MNEVSITIAFAAGVVSFLSPCVLPLVPGFLAYLAGGQKDGPPQRLEVFLNSVFFVLGFSVIFALIGVLLLSLIKFKVGWRALVECLLFCSDSTLLD